MKTTSKMAKTSKVEMTLKMKVKMISEVNRSLTILDMSRVE